MVHRFGILNLIDLQKKCTIWNIVVRTILNFTFNTHSNFFFLTIIMSESH